MKMTSKIVPPLQKYFGPRILPDFFLYPLTLTAMGQLILNRKCSQVSKLEMELHMIGMIYAALLMREQTEKTTFSCRDD